MPKLGCKCGRELELTYEDLARMAGCRLKCPDCEREATVPAASEPMEETIEFELGSPQIELGSPQIELRGPEQRIARSSGTPPIAVICIVLSAVMLIWLIWS